MISWAGLTCLAPWEAADRIDVTRETEPESAKQLLTAAIPNVGGFERVGRRFVSRVNPEYARTRAGRGVRLIGGCCGMHPEHIREMAGYLSARSAGIPRFAATPLPTAEPADDAAKRENGRFSRKLNDDEFAVSVELLPPRGTSRRVLRRKLDFVSDLAESELADAIDLTDGSRGIPLMPPGEFITLIRDRMQWNAATGDAMELIPHFTARDLNTMGLQSRLIGYHTTRVFDVLFITGDPPKMSPTYPRSTAVFDVDSIELIRYAHSFLNAGQDFGGQPLSPRGNVGTHFTIGTGFEPEAVDREREVDRLGRKIDGGADYIMTQPAFRHEPLDILEPFQGNIPILVGVMILSSLKQAERVAETPGVLISSSVFDRLAAFSETQDQAKVGRAIAIEEVEWVRTPGWSGVYLMSPAAFRTTTEVLEAAVPVA